MFAAASIGLRMTKCRLNLIASEPMFRSLHRLTLWALAWALTSSLGAVLIARAALSDLRNAFDTDARIVHRLLSQRVVQHDALLSSLALLQPPAGSEQRLSSVYPQILEIKRRESAAMWSDSSLAQAESVSRSQRRAALANLDFIAGRYTLVSAADPASFALQLDMRAVVPWAEWPMNPRSNPVRVSLEHLGQQYIVQTGQMDAGPSNGWRFEAQKNLASDSQPFNVVAVQQVGWSQLPWLSMGIWLLGVAAALAAMATLLAQREQRRRAEDLLRLGQVARLNQMGELAAGMAHELNQPLTAVLANTQAAQRLLAEEPPELDTARSAMGQAASQARRASDVIARLRRSIDPLTTMQMQALDLTHSAQSALHLLMPQLQSGLIEATVQAPSAVIVQADPVAVEQIIHNLITNALEAMARVPSHQRRLILSISSNASKGLLSVCDTGAGLSAEAMPRVFEPFFTTRPGGLGLGLSLCESLAEKMGGQLTARNNSGAKDTASSGATFILSLPLAENSSA